MEGSTAEVKLVLPDKAAGGAAVPPAPAGGAASTTTATKLKFDVNSSVTLPVTAKSVGQLTSITVRTDSSALGEGAAKTWHLARIEVTNESSGTAAIFPYKSYVSDGGITMYPQTSYTYVVSACRAHAAIIPPPTCISRPLPQTLHVIGCLSNVWFG